MGQRARKRRAQEPRAAEEPQGAAAPPRGYARSRAKDDAVRAELRPLAPGERPTAVTVAAVVAVLLALANVSLLVAGVDVRGEEASAPGVLAFSAVMLAAAAGLWQRKYWAVLGFEALLGFTILVAAVSLMTASNLAAVALCLAIILPSGWLFWKLIRAMARLQMPERRVS